MADDVLQLLMVHDYLLGLGDETLREVVSLARLVNVPAGAVVHEADQPLASVGFVLKGRLKAVRVDAQGHEHFFRAMGRGEQFGLMIGSLGESVPLRIVALEPSAILSLDYEQSMELPFKHPDLRRQWLRAFARTLQRHYFGATPHRTPTLLAVLHESPTTRPLAGKLVLRLRELGEEICVLSDSDEWRTIPDVQFRSIIEGDRLLPLDDIRRQIAEWNRAKRVLVDIRTSQTSDIVVRLMEAADRVLVFVRPGDITSASERFRAMDIQSRGWRDKISTVWLLDTGSNVAPAVPEASKFFNSDFKVSDEPLKAPWGRVLSSGVERLVHSLRGIRIGIALGGGAALGMSHLGVLKALDDNGIVVDMVVGTSAGAMTGVTYSAGWECAYAAERFAADLKPSWLFRRLRNGNYWYLIHKYRWGRFDPMLRKYLCDWKLEQLPLPCHGVTVDLIGAQCIVRDQGDATNMVLESINVPGLSRPICRNGQALVDGGLLNNIPADVLVSRGCNFVIAVSVTSKIERRFGNNTWNTPTHQMTIPSVMNTLLRAFQVQHYNTNMSGVTSADVVIEPDVANFDMSEFRLARELASAGERAALTQLPRIQQLLARLDPDLFRFGR